MKFFEYRFFALVLLCLVAFAGVFIRGDLFGFDSYASWGCVKGLDCSMLSWQPFAITLFHLLPDSLIVFKWLMFACFFLSITAIFCLVKNFYGEKLAWVSSFFVLALSPIALFGFGTFENELFAYPLLFWCLYLVCRKELWSKILAVGLVLFSLGFWVPGAIYLVPLALLWFPGLIFLGVGVFLWFWQGIGFLGGGSAAIEQVIGAGVFEFFLLLVVIPFFCFVKNKRLLVGGVIVLACSLISAKLVVLALPFCALGVAQLIKMMEEKSIIG